METHNLLLQELLYHIGWCEDYFDKQKSLKDHYENISQNSSLVSLGWLAQNHKK